MHRLVVVVLLAEQRGIRGGRPSAEGAGARVEGNGLRQQLTRRSRPRYVLSGTICDQNLIAFVRPSKCSQLRGPATRGSGATCPAPGFAGGGGGNPGEQKGYTRAIDRWEGTRWRRVEWVAGRPAGRGAGNRGGEAELPSSRKIRDAAGENHDGCAVAALSCTRHFPSTRHTFHRLFRLRFAYKNTLKQTRWKSKTGSYYKMQKNKKKTKSGIMQNKTNAANLFMPLTKAFMNLICKKKWDQ